MERSLEHPSDEDMIRYLDEGVQSPHLTEHIIRCTACSERLDAMRRTITEVKSHPIPELSAMLRARTLRSFMEYRHARPSVVTFLTTKIPMYQVAGIVAVLFALLQLIGSISGSTNDIRIADEPSFQYAIQERLIGP